MEGHCRLGITCAYKHRMRSNSDQENTHEDIKNIRAELDVLKQTVKALFLSNEQGTLLQNHIKNIKEEVKALIGTNKRTADKIRQLEDECNYDTEEELEIHKEKDTFVEDKIFEDFKEMYQIE